MFLFLKSSRVRLAEQNCNGFSLAGSLCTLSINERPLFVVLFKQIPIVFLPFFFLFEALTALEMFHLELCFHSIHFPRLFFEMFCTAWTPSISHYDQTVLQEIGGSGRPSHSLHVPVSCRLFAI